MTDNILDQRTELGHTGLRISPIAVGTGGWGLGSWLHGPVPESDAVATAKRAFEGPLNVLDTSNNYGDGVSETWVGRAIQEAGGLPAEFVLQTKLDRDPVTNSFDASRMRRSLEESLDRLGVSQVSVLYLHDPENLGFEGSMAMGGPVAELIAMRDEGLTTAIGVGGGPISMLRQFMATDIFDAVITHNRYTLVDRSAEPLLAECAERGIGVLNGAVYGGGVLAKWPRQSDNYHYRPAPRELLASIDAMGAACARHDVPLLAAALQFSLRDPRVSSTICGMTSVSQFTGTVALAQFPIPAQLWSELEELCPPPTSWIND